MIVFIAGSFAARRRLQTYRQKLRDLGYTVSSSWLDEPIETWPAVEQSKAQAIRDLQEIKVADAFILDTIDCTTMGNSYIEFGFALGRMMPKYIIGPRRNHYLLIGARQFETWEDFLDFFDSRI